MKYFARMLVAIFVALLLTAPALAQNAFSLGSTAVSNRALLPSAKLWVGDTNGIARAVTPSGDITVDNVGKFTIQAIQGVTVSGVTGTGPFVLQVGPSITSPIITTPTISGSFTLNGLTISAPNASSGTLTFPSGTTNFGATGGTSQVVMQEGSGNPFTVRQLLCADLSNATTTCSTSIGTSGATIPLLSTANTWTLGQTFSTSVTTPILTSAAALTISTTSGAITMQPSNGAVSIAAGDFNVSGITDSNNHGFHFSDATNTHNISTTSGTMVFNTFVSGGWTTGLQINPVAGATRNLKIIPSNGGNVTLDVTAGSMAITPAIVAASTVSATQYTSTIATGTAPLVVASTTAVANLNASLLNGATFSAPGTIGGGTPGAITGTTITSSETNPRFNFNDASLGTDLKVWQNFALSGNWAIYAAKDDQSASTVAYQITRGTTYNVASHHLYTSTSAGAAVEGFEILNTGGANHITVQSGTSPTISTSAGAAIYTSAAAVILRPASGSGINFQNNDGSNNVFIPAGSGAANYMSFVGGTNPTISTSAGNLAITPTTVFAGQIQVAAMTQTSAAQSGTMCYKTDGTITYDATLGCLASLPELKDIFGDIAPEEARRDLLAMRPIWASFKPGYDGGPVRHEEVAPMFNARQMATIDRRLVSFGPDQQLRGVPYAQMTAILAAGYRAHDADIADIRAQVDELRRRAANDNRETPLRRAR